ncbi:DPBB and LysM peptidoglycan-binding domain-containing protein [Lacticaseibacillus zhaodongensis]|uniref:DPBB and LysM peptidoglycan-binding domain-containing protein n=1 Tax=Lacticaseibacillus zhaodongensis TaxID=2668065 RepID=UPI0012D36F97|nr:LysM peptidoglycan-binding domain-containing protein [Lacticaseibacillus zhaodongensis]
MINTKTLAVTGKHGIMGGLAAIAMAASIFLMGGSKVSAATNWQARTVSEISSQIQTAGTSASYQIKWGDTLGNIAAALQENHVNVSSAELAKLNNMNEDSLIIAGNKLTVSGTGANTQVTVQSAQTQQQKTYSVNQSNTSSQQSGTQAATTTSNTAAATSSTSSTSHGTFKLSFYDPAVLGSNMGYSGVAANLSVFPKGTRLKITLSNGTVWYRTVNDTGSFAAANPRQLDVAMPISQIPSAGVMSATVEVIN